jgi:hypothetical protein
VVCKRSMPGVEQLCLRRGGFVWGVASGSKFRLVSNLDLIIISRCLCVSSFVSHKP